MKENRIYQLPKEIPGASREDNREP
jgi:hypothetical protein